MITPIYAGIIALLLIALSAIVSKGRGQYGAGIGDANNVDMKRRIRAQANLVEYAPIFLILAGFAEHNGLSPWAIHALCLAFLTGRILHAYSLLYAETYDGEKLTANPIWRICGMLLTLTSIAVLSIIMIVQGFAA